MSFHRSWACSQMRSLVVGGEGVGTTWLWGVKVAQKDAKFDYRHLSNVVIEPGGPGQWFECGEEGP